MIADHRLVTLIGPGGVGKTSLAMELARTVGGQFEDGVHVVEFVGVVDQDATAAALATAIDVNLRKSSSIDDAIVDLLRPRRSLLVLDNCEHLIEPVAELVARILREAPTIAIVATSREPLAVAGERLWTVDPLPTGPVDLFVSDLTLGELAEIPRSRASSLEPRRLTLSFALDEVHRAAGRRDLSTPRRHPAPDRVGRGTGAGDRRGRGRPTASTSVLACSR